MISENLELDGLASPPFSRPRVLMIGQARRASGYSRVVETLARCLSKGHDVIHFGIDYYGPPIEDEWRLEPNLTGDLFGYSQMPDVLGRLKPDVIFMCDDPHLHGVLAPQLSRNSPRSPVVFYCPIGAAITVPGDYLHLSQVDRLVAYTEFGRRALDNTFTELRRSDPGAEKPPIHVIPHGVNTEAFRPLFGSPSATNLRRSRVGARAVLFGDRPELRDAFIVLNANRNIRRKRVDLTLEAFAEFARGKTDVWLYLHMGMRDVGIDVMETARRLRIEDRLLLTTTFAAKPEVSDDRLNLIYNACDLGVNTATGEGWGLVAFEHAAAGAAQIVPAHSACQETWSGVGLLVPVLESQRPLNDDPRGGIVNTHELVARLEHCYADRSHLQSASEAAYSYARSSQFQWQNIAASWERLFASVLAETSRAAHPN